MIRRRGFIGGKKRRKGFLRRRDVFLDIDKKINKFFVREQVLTKEKKKKNYELLLLRRKRGKKIFFFFCKKYSIQTVSFVLV